jgi:hypothetical protein
MSNRTLPAKKKTSTNTKKSTRSKAAPIPTKHFAYLASSENDEALLKLIFDSAKVSEQKGNLIVKLKGGYRLEASAPAKKIPANAPKTFRAVLEQHASIALMKDKNIVLELAVTGIFDTETLEENESAVLQFVKNRKDLIFPLSEWQDCWVYNPSEKNETKEPVIYFLSHETVEPTRPQPCNIGSLFLQRCASHLEIALPKSQPDKDNSSIELIAKPNDLFKDARCLNLQNGKILLLKKDHISLLDISNNKFTELGRSKLPTVPADVETVHSQELEDGTIILEIAYHGIFSLQIKNNNPVNIEILEGEYKGNAALLVDKKLIFYNNDSPGFYLKSLGKHEKKTILKTKPLYINSGIAYENLMIFAGADDIMGFEFKENQFKRIFKTKVDLGSPVITHTPDNNYFLVLDANPPITVFKYASGKLNRVSSHHHDISPLQWCWAKSELYVFFKDNNKQRYFVGSYTWEKRALKIKKLIEVDLKNPKSKTNWVWPTSLHINANILHIINADGMVWELPVN